MKRAAAESLKALGMERHQALVVSHRDGQPHVHVIANRVDPESGKRRFPIDQFIESRISSRQSPLERRIDEMLGTLEPGDRLLVSELSRLGRSLSQVIQIVGRQEVKAQLLHKIETGPPSGGLELWPQRPSRCHPSP